MERWHGDCAGIGHQPRRGVVQIEQNIDGDLAENLRVGSGISSDCSASCVSIFAFT